MSDEHDMCCGTTCCKDDMAAELKGEGATEFAEYLVTELDMGTVEELAIQALLVDYITKTKEL